MTVKYIHRFVFRVMGLQRVSLRMEILKYVAPLISNFVEGNIHYRIEGFRFSRG
jgi:hypothetical protein